ncbi:hypothetical protein, partial [Pigmentiphaga soli]|uniref:hypothetical protein n=1 Tax=Pigmentiphaga soli TaxID=1007095 RepID=UPI0031EAD268
AGRAAAPRRRRRLAGGAALALCAAGAFWNGKAFMASWLAAWWFWFGLGLGAQAIVWLHRLTGGAWGAALMPALDRLRAPVPIVAALVLPVLLVPSALYPWAAGAAPEEGFPAAWLTPAGVALRGIAWVALCALLCLAWGRGRRPASAGFAALGLAAYGYGISLGSVDLLMSLVPHWYSAGFGLTVAVASMKCALAAAALRQAPALPPPLRADAGNLLLMFVMTWAYLSYTQLLIIWAENLPHEIAWYLPRLQTGWAWLGLLLAAAGFALPMALLLFRRLKTDARWLRAIAAVVLATGWADVLWWILPSVAPVGFGALWMLPLATLGMGAVASAWPWRPPPAPAAARGAHHA